MGAHLHKDTFVTIDGGDPVTWLDFVGANDELVEDEIAEIERCLLTEGAANVGIGGGFLEVRLVEPRPKPPTGSAVDVAMDFMERCKAEILLLRANKTELSAALKEMVETFWDDGSPDDDQPSTIKAALAALAKAGAE